MARQWQCDETLVLRAVQNPVKTALYLSAAVKSIHFQIQPNNIQLGPYYLLECNLLCLCGCTGLIKCAMLVNVILDL